STVVESSDTRILINVDKDGQVSHNEMKKTETIEACEKAGGVAQYMTGGAKLIESRAEAITVKAGTFNCQFSKYTYESNENGINQKSIVQDWTTSDNVFLSVKTISTSTVVYNGQTFNMKYTRELVDLKKK